MSSPWSNNNMLGSGSASPGSMTQVPPNTSHLSPGMMPAIPPDGSTEVDEASIAQLCEITGAEYDVARIMLLKCHGIVENAIDTLLERQKPTLVALLIITKQLDHLSNEISLLKQRFPLVDHERVLREVVAVRLSDPGVYEYFGAKAKDNGATQFTDVMMAKENAITNVAGVVGFLDGVISFADKLNEHLTATQKQPHNLFGNTVDLADARHDKFLMQDVLKKAGIGHAKSLLVCGAEAALAAISNGHIDLPVVVKPCLGAGTEFVSYCDSEEDVRVAIECATGFESTQNTVLESFCLQEFLDGTEYVVDIVSHKGVHVVTDVWRSVKTRETSVGHRLRRSVKRRLQVAAQEAAIAGADPSTVKAIGPPVKTTSFCYGHQDFVIDCKNDPAAMSVIEYTIQCLDTLQFLNGPSHTEVMLTSSGPQLIELNPRMQGDTPRSTDLVGYDQLTLVAYLASVRPELIAAGDVSAYWPPMGVPTIYHPPACASPSSASGGPETMRILFMKVNSDGIVSERGKEQLRRMRTFRSFTRCMIDHSPSPGKVHIVERTHDIFSCPGALILRGTEADIERDSAWYRQIENGELGGNENSEGVKMALMLLQSQMEAMVEDHAARVAAARENGEDPTAVQHDYGLVDATLRREVAMALLSLPSIPLFIGQETFDLLRNTAMIRYLGPDWDPQAQMRQAIVRNTTFPAQPN